MVEVRVLLKKVVRGLCRESDVKLGNWGKRAFRALGYIYLSR